MRISRTAILVALAVAGSAGYAAAQQPAMHTMTVKMPDGGIATIRYSGNVAPNVTFGRAPWSAAFFGASSPFAAFDRISAQMNREMDVLLRQAHMLALPFADSNPLFHATLHPDGNRAPSGLMQYSMMSTLSGNGSCTRSVAITSSGNGAKPHIVSQTSGHCAKTAGHAKWSAAPAQAAAKRARTPGVPMFYDAGYAPH